MPLLPPNGTRPGWRHLPGSAEDHAISIALPRGLPRLDLTFIFAAVNVIDVYVSG